MNNLQKYGLFVKINDAEGLMAVSQEENFTITFRPSEVPSLGYTADNGETVTLHYRKISDEEAIEGAEEIKEKFFPKISILSPEEAPMA